MTARKDTINLPPKVRDEWHRYTGQERTPPPAKWNRAVKGEVLRALRMIEADCTVNGYGKYLHSLVNKFTDDQARSKKWRDYVGSFEDCLWLFPVDGFVLFIQRHPDVCTVDVRRAKKPGVVIGQAVAITLEIALLRLYWQMQPD